MKEESKRYLVTAVALLVIFVCSAGAHASDLPAGYADAKPGAAEIAIVENAPQLTVVPESDDAGTTVVQKDAGPFERLERLVGSLLG